MKRYIEGNTKQGKGKHELRPERMPEFMPMPPGGGGSGGAGRNDPNDNAI